MKLRCNKEKTSRLRGKETKNKKKGEYLRIAKRNGLYLEIKRNSRVKKEKDLGPRGIFLKAFSLNGKVEDGIKALMNNGIDPRSFGIETLKSWADELKNTNPNTAKKIEDDEGR